MNEDGNVDGTVEGIIELPDGDGTGLEAISVTVNSGLTLPISYPIIFNGSDALPNSFDVINGQIDKNTSSFGANLQILALLEINDSGRSFLGTSIPLGGNNIEDSDSSTLEITPVVSQVVTEPSSILGLGTAIGFGTAFKRKLGTAKKNGNK